MNPVFQILAVELIFLVFVVPIMLRLSSIGYHLPHIARRCDWSDEARKLRERLWAEESLLKRGLILALIAFPVVFLAVFYGICRDAGLT